ncbi:MAG TPA: PRC-barrel domain-containing protein [Paracoccaceae bacterium]|nr:PRC-barrel domain-containing protein [Paracoccaceae bacterium]
MTDRGNPSILAGAALALILATPLPLQAQSEQNAENGAEIPEEAVTPENTAEAARNAGAAEQVMEQLDRAKAEIERDDVDAAKTEMNQALQMLQRARIIGSEDRLQSIKTHLEDAVAALEAEDLEKAEDAIGSARSEIAEVERDALEQADAQAKEPGDEQKATTEGGAELTVIGEGETEALPREGDAEQRVPKPERLSTDETRRRLALGDREVGDPTGVEKMAVGDLQGRDVVSDSDGEEIGSVGDIVSNGDHLFAIIEHGGFLGIGGDEIAVPLNRLGLRGDNLVLLGLSDEQIEHIPDYDYDGDQALDDENTVEIGRYE